MNSLTYFFNQIGQDVTRTIHTDSERIANIPNYIIGMAVFMSASALIQAVGDLIIEWLMFTEIISFKIELRLEFLFLTLISAFIAYLTLRGMREGNLDVTKNTLSIGLAVESALVLGDIYLLSQVSEEFVSTAITRGPFIFLTSINIVIISFILLRNFLIRRDRHNYQF